VPRDREEKSPSGAPVYRHEPKQRPFTGAAAELSTLAELERHFTTYFGEPTSVFHEVISELVHVDLHLVPPAPARDYWTVLTTGMSDLPMTAPAGSEEFRFAELMVKIPASWPLDQLKVTPPPPDLEQWYWPLRWLKMLARLPHEYETWLGSGHTVPNGDPPQPFAPGTKLCAFILLPPVSVPAEAGVAKLSDGRAVHLYVLHALHLEELTLKLTRGAGALLDAFDEAKVSEVLDLRRPSCVRRKLFGLF
jgi:Suppressor of fused protein (SUFU)